VVAGTDTEPGVTGPRILGTVFISGILGTVFISEILGTVFISHDLDRSEQTALEL
jgi:photosystem II stability/assembly factor-like uncharacterized protein